MSLADLKKLEAKVSMQEPGTSIDPVREAKGLVDVQKLKTERPELKVVPDGELVKAIAIVDKIGIKPGSQDWERFLKNLTKHWR